MHRVLNALFPRPTAISKDDIVNSKILLKSDVDLIRDTKWTTDCDIALEEARILAALEGDRRKAAENKASIYLAVVAGLIPFISSQAIEFSKNNFQGYILIFKMALAFLFLLGLSYLLLSGFWSFRVLRVSIHNRVDTEDYVKIWENRKAKEALVAELFVATRLNREGVNEKTGQLKLTHIYLIRSVFVFTSILAVMALGRIDYKSIYLIAKSWFGFCG